MIFEFVLPLLRVMGDVIHNSGIQSLRLFISVDNFLCNFSSPILVMYISTETVFQYGDVDFSHITLLYVKAICTYKKNRDTVK